MQNKMLFPYKILVSNAFIIQQDAWLEGQLDVSTSLWIRNTFFFDTKLLGWFYLLYLQVGKLILLYKKWFIVEVLVKNIHENGQDPV